MKKIFMTCYGGGHAEIIKEVYKNLINISDIEITILALTTSKYKFEQERIPYKVITDYYNKEKDKEIYKLGKEFCIKNNIDTSIGEDETYLYHGYPLFEQEKKYGKKKIEEGFKKYGRGIFLPLQFMKKILQLEKPNLVVTTNSPRYEKAALIVAKSLNIKTLSIEDLFGVEYKIYSDEMVSFFNDLIYKNVYGENLCIISEESKKNLLNAKTSNFFITGNPAFDKAIKFYNEHHKEIKKNKEKVTLCFLSQNYPERFLIVKELKDIVKEHKNFDLIIKIHPNEKLEEYISYIDENTKVINSNLYETIFKSDIIITVDSTAALEAVILDKTVVAKKNDYIPFENMNIGVEYKSISDIKNKINEVLYNNEVINCLKKGRKLFRPIEFSGLKIKKIIEKIINNN
ncbi:hypothetical protein [Fusobacterium nucleatum]|uniref:hypothetical protein n=1 Tax=Fusobacterium nucleatum TaxID=851 RepID=UPI0030CF4F55